MSQQLPRSTALAAALTGVLALGALLGWGLVGGDDGGDAGASAEGAQELPELDEGFEAIPQAEFFATISQAQQDAKSWETSSVATQGGQEGPTSLIQLMYTDEGPRFRVQMEADRKEVRDGLVEGLYVGETFYLKGLNPAKWDETWYQVPNDDQLLASFESMLQGSVASSLEAFGEPKSFEVVGVEEVTELDDDAVRAAHYRIEVDPSATMGGQGVTEELLTLDIWVDEHDRPVQVESQIRSGDQEMGSALYYSDYGKDFQLEEPAARDVTERRPPSMRQPELPAG